MANSQKKVAYVVASNNTDADYNVYHPYIDQITRRPLVACLS